jgi:hypothetical protein
MELGVDSILLAIAFLLPGFLTSSLVIARTPAKPPKLSAFEETAQSLLRSAYIHLFLAATVTILASALLLAAGSRSFPDLDLSALTALLAAHPLPTAALLVLWLAAAFGLAILFGYWRDPLDSLTKRLHKGAGKVSEDAFHLLTEEVKVRRNSGAEGLQLWVQATTTENHIFQGQFFYASYQEADQPRELLLAKAFHFEPPRKTAPRRKTGPQDFVFLPMDSCHALEFRIVDPQAKSAAA